MAKRPTIIDVARKAGVSKSTVSLVLQNSPLVKDETRLSVERAIADLNYVYNRSAAHLRGSGGGLVALVVNELHNPYFAEFAISAQTTLSKAGYTTAIAHTDDDPDTEHQIITSMVEHGVAGIMISPCYSGQRATFDYLARANVPVLQVLRRVDQRSDLFPFAAADDRIGGRLAAEHLLKTGARDIAFVGGTENGAVTVDRMVGYLEAMNENDLPTRAILGRPSREFGWNAAHRLAKCPQRCDAAICFNDLVALGMHAAFERLGVETGRTFRLVGFDDLDESRQVTPQLTSIHSDIKGFAHLAASALVKWIDKGVRPLPEYRAPVRLIERASSGRQLETAM